MMKMMTMKMKMKIIMTLISLRMTLMGTHTWAEDRAYSSNRWLLWNCPHAR